MTVPKFLIGDHSDYQDDIFVIHTEFPRFIINLKNDEIKWLEEFTNADKEELSNQVAGLIEEASAFYDAEINYYEDNESN
ncbi:MAG: hypothetical protein ACWA42_02360 [Lutibacter sp.]